MVQKAACVHSYSDSLNWFILALEFNMKDTIEWRWIEIGWY